MKLKWEREHPLMNLIQMATIKVDPKIPFAILKSHINECDHISCDVEPIHAHGFFKYSTRSLELNKYLYLNLNSNILNFKNVQTLDMTSYWSCNAI